VVYNFNEQLKHGDKGEAELDRYFEKFYIISKVSAALQKQGIDRIFIDDFGSNFFVEYKTDYVGDKSGNAFIETVSVSSVTSTRLGWIHTSKAHWIIYYLAKSRIAYVLSPPKLRPLLDEWHQKYPKRCILNQGWHTEGLLVPLSIIQKLAATQLVISG